MAFNKVSLLRWEFSGLMLEKTHSVGAMDGLEFFSAPTQSPRLVVDWRSHIDIVPVG